MNTMTDKKRKNAPEGRVHPDIFHARFADLMILYGAIRQDIVLLDSVFQSITKQSLNMVNGLKPVNVCGVGMFNYSRNIRMNDEPKNSD